jgi:hypothetical protein
MSKLPNPISRQYALKYRPLLYNAIRAMDREISVVALLIHVLQLLGKAMSENANLALHADLPLIVEVTDLHAHAHARQWKANRDVDHISLPIPVNLEVAPKGNQSH